MTSTILNHDYLAALLLNNIGVAFLSDGCFKEGMTTLKDSPHAMKRVFRFHNEGSVEVDTALQVHQRLGKAKQRWMEHIAGDSTALIETVTCFQIERLSYEQCCISQLITEGSTLSDDIRATTIDVPADASNLRATGRDPDLETIVIICNLALSHYLVSERVLHRRRKLALQLISQSFNILDLAFDIVSSRFALCEDDAEESRLLTVALLVTGTSMLIYRKTGHDAQAAELQDKYHRLQRTIGMRQDAGSLELSMQACAAE